MTSQNEELLRVFAEVGRRFGEAVNRDFMRIAATFRPMVDAVWTAYRAVGAPYGDSEEGMLRWLGERQQIANLRAQAERLESIQRTCAQLRASRGRT